jgi:hypothetical protein
MRGLSLLVIPSMLSLANGLNWKSSGNMTSERLSLIWNYINANASNMFQDIISLLLPHNYPRYSTGYGYQQYSSKPISFDHSWVSPFNCGNWTSPPTCTAFARRASPSWGSNAQRLSKTVTTLSGSNAGLPRQYGQRHLRRVHHL